MDRRLLQGFVFAFVAVGCSDTAADHNATVQVETLPTGYAEVANTGGSNWTPETAWRLEEDLRLGTAEGEGPQQFGEIGSVLSGPRGMIYVLDLFYHHIQVFHPDGSFSHTIGREGLGPGEFTAARAMTFGPGDTLWVLDDGAARYSAFAPNGTFLKSEPRRIRGFLRTSSGAVLLDGRYVDWGLAFPDGRFGPRMVYWPIRFAVGFERVDSLPPLLFTQPMMLDGRMPQIFFGAELSAAVDRRGNIWFAHTQEYRIYRRTLEGDTTLVFGLPAEAAPVGEAEREYLRANFARTSLSKYLDGLPERKPIVQRIIPDNTGHIFVFPEVSGAPAGTIVDVFQESGEYLGRMTLPIPAQPISYRPSLVASATPEHLLVAFKDTFDAPYVARLKIVKGR